MLAALLGEETAAGAADEAGMEASEVVLADGVLMSCDNELAGVEVADEPAADTDPLIGSGDTAVMVLANDVSPADVDAT